MEPIRRQMRAMPRAGEQWPPGTMLVNLGRALRVSAYELLGMHPVEEETSPKAARVMKRLLKIEDLLPTDQRAVLKFLDALLENRGVA